MSNYIGVRCPVCNKKFTQADDIVVCPICGAPHHRECYAVNAACAFDSEHINGKEWRAAPSDPPQDTDARPNVSICPSCNSPNPKGVIFCQICGRRMGEVQSRGPEGAASTWGFPEMLRDIDPIPLMYGGLSPDETINDESVRDLAVYVGENSAYYLPRFKMMEETSRSLSFNVSALIFNFLYFFNRKMYLIGAFLLAMFIAGAIPGFLRACELMPQVLYSFGLGPDVPVNQQLVEHYQNLISISSMINFMIGLVLSFCANRFYYVKAMSDIKKIRADEKGAHDEAAYKNALAKKGGSNKAAVIAAICGIAAAYFIAATAMSYYFLEVGGFM